MDDNSHFTKCYHPISTASLSRSAFHSLPTEDYSTSSRVTLTLLALPQIGQTPAPMVDSHPLTMCGSYARCHGETAQTQTILLPLVATGRVRSGIFRHRTSQKISQGVVVPGARQWSWLNVLKTVRLPRLQKFLTGVQGYKVYMAVLEPRSYKSSSHTPLKG